MQVGVRISSIIILVYISHFLFFLSIFSLYVLFSALEIIFVFKERFSCFLVFVAEIYWTDSNSCTIKALIKLFL